MICVYGLLAVGNCNCKHRENVKFRNEKNFLTSRFDNQELGNVFLIKTFQLFDTFPTIGIPHLPLPNRNIPSLHQCFEINSLAHKPTKLERVVPMVVVSILPHAEFGPNDHREDASHFTNVLIDAKEIQFVCAIFVYSINSCQTASTLFD